MRLHLTALVTALLGLLGPGTASAANDSTYSGGCRFALLGNPKALRHGSGTYRGVLHIDAVVYSPSSPATPVTAEITCRLMVTGVPRAGALTASGTGVVAGATGVTFTTSPLDDVYVCVRIDFLSDGTPTQDFCVVCSCSSVPQEVAEPRDQVLDAADELVVCPATGGDVYVGDEAFYECAPYE